MHTLKVITLPYNSHTQRLEGDPLEEIQRAHEVLRHHSYLVGPPEAQSLVLLLTLAPREARPAPRHTVTRVPAPAPAPSGAPSGAPAPEGRRAREQRLDAALAALRDDERHAFERLREWRNEEGARLGIPPFEICSNVALVECVARRPSTLTALRAVEGIGPRRAKRFGEALLAQLAAHALIAPLAPPAEAEAGAGAGA
ncbi:MAG: hypothetical protein FJ138_16105 [Deltaproteobacteria bacterium]|nr:hypothetical protein [Deltaproteobacteria bacterium]